MSITKLVLMLVCLMSVTLAMGRSKREAHGKVVRLVLASQVASLAVVHIDFKPRHVQLESQAFRDGRRQLIRFFSDQLRLESGNQVAEQSLKIASRIFPLNWVIEANGNDLHKSLEGILLSLLKLHSENT